MSNHQATGRKPKPTLTYISEDWHQYAECANSGVDPEIFFTDCGNSYEAHQARTICARCPVKQECLEYSLRAPMRLDGIWGGLGVGRRDELRRGYPDVFRHGTEAGAKRHYRRGEKPCPACLEASRTASRLRKAEL